MSRRWEYRVEKVERGSSSNEDDDLAALEDRLDALGLASWELVTTFERPSGNTVSSELVLLFKRPMGG